jgi:hypothetical protein
VRTNPPPATILFVAAIVGLDSLASGAISI